MSFRRAFVVAVALSASSLPTVLGADVQNAHLKLPRTARANQAKVVKIFTDAYQTYRRVAFGHDDLQPVSLTFNDGRNGWGATIVDSMSTMAIMGLDDLFNEALAFSSKIDFSQSKVDESVSVFETTIRYLGGLLSAYQLSGSKHQVLVDKAKQVGDKMAFAWVGNNSIPFGELNFTTNTPFIQTSNIAEAGTITLEWSMLSKLTGNDTYRQLAEKSVRQIASLTDPLPGLAAQGIDPSTGQFVGGYVTWGGGSDSYFEYLIKYPRLTLTDDPIFVSTWKAAVDSSIRSLARRSTVGNHLYLADFDDSGMIRNIGSHLECFHGGNWLLGGQLLNNQTIVDFALELVDACWNTYQSTATGIGPEVFAYISSNDLNGTFTGGDPPSVTDLAFYEQHGFYIFNGGSDYILRPEVLESNFYAWRVSGDVKYQQRAAQAIDSINTFLAVNGAFAGIDDVNSINSTKIDDTESFFFAEVLKYLYLTFDDPNHISLDHYVFNTEAHPFIAPPTPASFGGGTTTKPSPPGRPFHAVPGPLPAVSPNSFLPKQIVPLVHGTPL
ncbi:seven-hairpin glycosidase [Rickenella mellea]|uniref:alpha-1,2-Mannosidase n=1 Tax=Rickenella mellea TaxID=50990 RepID=A0A4Y7Q6C0_9AGAM|nr:seven-hairpin glycosidase [Rickenella mellea]